MVDQEDLPAWAVQFRQLVLAQDGDELFAQGEYLGLIGGGTLQAQQAALGNVADCDVIHDCL